MHHRALKEQYFTPSVYFYMAGVTLKLSRILKLILPLEVVGRSVAAKALFAFPSSD